MKKNKFLALTMLCSLFSQMPTIAHEIKDPDFKKIGGVENSSNSSNRNKNKNVKASKDSEFLDCILEFLLAGGIFEGIHECLSYRYGQENQFYEKPARYSLVDKYHRYCEAIDKAYKAINKAINKARGKIENLINLTYLKDLSTKDLEAKIGEGAKIKDLKHYFFDFAKLPVELRDVCHKYKEQIISFWGSKNYQNALIVPFSNEEFWDVLLSTCNVLEKQEFNKYAKEIKRNIRLVAVARFLPGSNPCLTFAISNSDQINEVDKILTGNNKLGISFSNCLDVFKLSEINIGISSFRSYQPKA